MKRYLICAKALTTGQLLVHNWGDTPEEAYDLAKKVQSTGAREVQVRDSQENKLYDLDAFVIVHRLA